MRAWITKSLQPGMPGTKKLVEKYGESLLCVRYRVDQEAGKRYKTVELIEESRVIEESPQLQLPQFVSGAPFENEEHGEEEIFWFRFRGYLPDLFQLVIRAGGRRGEVRGVWGVPWKEAEARGLLDCGDLEKV